MPDSVGLVIPAYNPNVSQLTSYLETVHAVVQPDDVLIELDAPDSPTVVEELSRTNAVVNAVDERRGKGAAITRGFDQLDTDILAFADADGSTPATSLADVIRGLNRADVSVGSRRHPEATISMNQSALRQGMGDIFAWWSRRLLNVDLYDFQCGAKAMTSEAWALLREHVYEAGFAWDLEVIAMADACGLRLAEVPITWEDQPGSTVDPIQTAIELGTALLVLHHRMEALSGSTAHRLISHIETQASEE